MSCINIYIFFGFFYIETIWMLKKIKWNEKKHVQHCQRNEVISPFLWKAKHIDRKQKQRQIQINRYKHRY